MLICNERHFFAVTQTEMKIEKKKIAHSTQNKRIMYGVSVDSPLDSLP